MPRTLFGSAAPRVTQDYGNDGRLRAVIGRRPAAHGAKEVIYGSVDYEPDGPLAIVAHGNGVADYLAYDATQRWLDAAIFVKFHLDPLAARSGGPIGELPRGC